MLQSAGLQRAGHDRVTEQPQRCYALAPGRARPASVGFGVFLGSFSFFATH